MRFKTTLLATGALVALAILYALVYFTVYRLTEFRQ